MALTRCAALAAAALLALAAGAAGKVTEAEFQSDNRDIIEIVRPFGFYPGGHVEIELWDAHVLLDEGVTSADKTKLGFFLYPSEAETALQSDLASSGECLLGDENGEKLFDFADVDSGKGEDGHFTYQKVIADDKAGEYQLVFVNCQSKDVVVSYKIRASLYNQAADGARDFLSAGEAPLPTVYMIMFVMYTSMLVMWCVVIYKMQDNCKKIHYFMAVLLLFKSLTVLCQAGKYHLTRIHGDPEGWNIAYYVFTFVRGVFLFSLIVLIGTGWSYVKPFLADREKKVLMIVIPLQVFANVASIILDEGGPSEKGWFTWRDIFHLVDIICCCAILFPIVWQIKHLREAASADGKAARNIHKLTLFRQFYVMVVSYIYFTRIVVYLLRSTTPYQYVWLSYAASELASLLFYSVSGFLFRPQPENPYLHLELDELDLEELELIAQEQSDNRAANSVESKADV